MDALMVLSVMRMMTVEVGSAIQMVCVLGLIVLMALKGQLKQI